jgi:hypothetical protein
MADTLSALKIPKATAFLSGANAPVTPKGYVGMRELAPIQEELAAAESQAQKDVGMADIQVERAKKEEATRDLESQAKFAKEEADKLRDLPERQAMKEKRKEFGDFKFVPTKENAQDLATLFSLVSVIGMAIGGGGKENSQAAMSAMNGMLEGHQKGRADLYKQQQVEFDKNFKAMQAAVQSAEKEYEEAVKMHMVDKEAGEMARKMALAKMHSPMLKAMEDRLGPLAVLNTLKELKTSVKNATELENKLQSQADKRQDAKDAREAAERRHREDLAARERQHRETLASKGGVGSDTASDVKNFTGVNFGTGKQADTKYDQVAAAANTMAEALALSNAVRKNPEVVGRVGQAKGLIDRYVKSLDSNGKETESTPTEGSVKNKAEQDALLFSKRYAAYLIRYEQALAGSAKGFTVSFMNRFNNLMQQNQFNPEGFDGLMKEQIREIHSRTAALSTKITPESMMRLGVAQTRDPDAMEALSRMQGGVGAAPAAAVSAGPGGSAKRGGAVGETDSVSAERSRAKAAIAAGAPETAVKERFKAKTGQEL